MRDLQAVFKTIVTLDSVINLVIKVILVSDFLILFFRKRWKVFRFI